MRTRHQDIWSDLSNSISEGGLFLLRPRPSLVEGTKQPQQLVAEGIFGGRRIMRIMQLNPHLCESAVLAQTLFDLHGVEPSGLNRKPVDLGAWSRLLLRRDEDVRHEAEARPRRHDGDTAGLERATNLARARRGVVVKHEAHVGDAVRKGAVREAECLPGHDGRRAAAGDAERRKLGGRQGHHLFDGIDGVDDGNGGVAAAALPAPRNDFFGYNGRAARIVQDDGVARRGKEAMESLELQHAARDGARAAAGRALVCIGERVEMLSAGGLRSLGWLLLGRHEGLYISGYGHTRRRFFRSSGTEEQCAR
ncbi:hypothetical protein CCM_01635 [Cordyceps militaris CM01]|uniref:Uncharacterized protein n=1 Tax=Cordyceps militaris (strain CM01) TaxID=983644 RepID=G3J677_CORMM|nr:uncharacterized protein CCM_01635 [Cordyceps militaris CM01]EGX96976.1 hypothetical protein CCM_01635 [Cordyceps militaris CM01]